MISLSHPPASAPADTLGRTAAYLRLCGLDPLAAGELAHHSLDEIQGRLDEWATSLVPAKPDESPAQHQARARAQLLLARAPARWPGDFLRTPPPPDLAAAVQAAVVEAKRPLRQTSMAPQPIDLGPVSEVADETWKTFDKWPVLRGLTTWLLFSLLLGAVFYVVRF
jgi:hypothetical protein